MRWPALIIANAVVLTTACDPTGDIATGCLSHAECPASVPCYRGRCTDSPYVALSPLYVELVPPDDSPWLPQHVPDLVDVSESTNLNLLLRPPVIFRGKIVPDGSGPGAASRTGTLELTGAGNIPGQRIRRVTGVASSGFHVALMPDTYVLLFTPDLPTRPPITFYDLERHADVEENLPYPVDGDLLIVRGRVTCGISGLEGARVDGTSRDSAGWLQSSTTDATDPNGEYEVVFLPDTQVITIYMKPDSNPLVPEMTLFVDVPIPQPPGWLPDINLALAACTDPPPIAPPTPKVRLSGMVSTHDGLPVRGVQVELTHHAMSSIRRFSTVTGADGWYSVEVDASIGTDDIKYELIVDPDYHSGVPWYRDLILVGDVDIRHDIELYAPAFLFGRVRDPSGTAASEILIRVYSSDLVSNAGAVLFGEAVASQNGEFVLALPALGY